MFSFQIKKDGVNKDVEDCEKKELSFDASIPCAKIIQTGKLSAESASEQSVAFSPHVSFPIEIYCFVYDSDLEVYEPINLEFDEDYMYFPGVSKDPGSYFYYFVCYS